ncbi:MAG: peptidase C39 family protein [Anaerolineae bacterium]
MNSNAALKGWLPIIHQKQLNRADCLVACVLMILNYLDYPATSEQITRLFDMDPDLGVPASRIKRLEQWGLHILYVSGTMNDLRQHLAQKEPCIAFVNTIHLPYWDEMTRHALVVSGIDEHYVYLNDPFFDEAPQSVTHLEFMLAWDEFENTYAVISK